MQARATDSYPKRPDHLWFNTPRLLVLLSFGAEMAWGLILIIHLHQVPRLRMCGAILPVAYIPSWLGQAIIFVIFYEKECFLQLHVRIKLRTKQRVSFFIVLPSAAPLSHRKPALVQTSCRDQDTDKRNELHLEKV
jgi:hypothetical protein